MGRNGYEFYYDPSINDVPSWGEVGLSKFQMFWDGGRGEGVSLGTSLPYGDF